jgi:carboxyl-terminal processing protease
VTDLFLADGMIATLVGRDGIEEQRARAPGSWLGFPIAVLVDEGTASAAELAGAALQENGRALVVGSRTYGKGSVQTFIDLGDGSGLKLTTARYRTPRGQSLDGVGVAPDVSAGADPAPGEPAAVAPGGDPKVSDHRLGIAYQTVRRAAASKEPQETSRSVPKPP